MEQSVADSDIVAGLDIPAEAAYGLADMGIGDVERAVVSSGIVAVVDRDAETFPVVAGNARDDAGGQGLQPRLRCDLEIDTVMEELFSGLWVYLLAVAKGDLQRTGLRQLKGHGIATR